jgi:hypothetical protein
MTLGELVNSCGLKSGFSDTAYRPNWLIFINEAVREFARQIPWDGLEDTTNILSDGSKFLFLPTYVDSIVWLLNLTDSRPVQRTGDWDREATAPYAQAVTGPALQYDKIGEVPTFKAPAGYIWFQSTHASDVQQIYITGLITNSGASGPFQQTFRELSIAATGTTPVTLTTLFNKVFSISKATDANGDFYFYDAGASNVHISWLGRTEPEAKLKRLQLLYIPSAGTNFELRFRYKIPKLTQDAQAPHPTVKPDFIIQHALALHYEEQEQNQKAGAQQVKALRTLEQEAKKDIMFDEPFSKITPELSLTLDDDDFYSRWY